MRMAIVCIFLTLWSLCTIFIGIPRIYNLLGGSTGFYYLIPLITSLGCARKNTHFYSFYKVLWSFILTITSLLIVNALDSYFISYHSGYDLLLIAYMVSNPVLFIGVGFTCTIASFIPLSKLCSCTEDLNKSCLFFIYLIFASLCVFPLCSLLIIFPFHESSDTLGLGYPITLGALSIGSLLLMFESRKLSIENLISFAKPSHRINTSIDVTNFRPHFVISIILFGIFSTYFEFIYRKQMIIWLETFLVFISYLLLLYNLTKADYEVSKCQPGKYEKQQLSSIRTERTIVKMVLALVIYFVLTIWWVF